MRHLPDPIVTPDAADFARIFVAGVERAGLSDRDGQQPERISFNAVFVENLADDLWVFAEGEEAPDLIEVATRCVALLLCRFDEYSELPFITVEALETLAEDNGAVADLADQEAIDDLRLMMDYLDTYEPSHLEVLRLWLRRRLFVSSDDEAWAPPAPTPAEPHEAEQLTLEDLFAPTTTRSPSARPAPDPDPQIMALLLPAEETPRVFIAGAMTRLGRQVALEIVAAASLIAQWLRERGFKVHEPTAVQRDYRPDSTIEAIDLDRLADTDILIVLGDPGATGIGIILGKAMHTDPVRLLFIPPEYETTPLLDHVTATGGAVYEVCDKDGLLSRLQEFLTRYQDAIQARVARRLAWARYSNLHVVFLSAIRAARLRDATLSSSPISGWRLSQLERSVAHFAQAGLDELSLLADWLELPRWWREALIGLEDDNSPAPDIPDYQGDGSHAPEGTGTPEGDNLEKFSAREFVALLSVQKQDERPDWELPILLSRAEERRRREDSLAVADRSRAALDEAGWRRLRRQER